MFKGEPTLDLSGESDLTHLLTDELSEAIALFENVLDPLPDARLPLVNPEAVVDRIKPDHDLHPEPGVLDGIFD
ncbi:MAG: hypothetical protein KIH63_001325 [Candidatus Saccharibacteria bacterium]|nr:hypothetical protein [Candidatus Saccharibacteria bacterium]